MVVSPSQPGTVPRNWPSARYFTEAIQCPSICFAHPHLRNTLPAVDRLGMPLVTSGQFAYVYKLKSMDDSGDFAVRCFRGYLGDRDQRYRAIQTHLKNSPVSYLSDFTYAPEGILVGGNRFPILFMKWIEGPTLDLYISEMLNRPDVLLHLSEEWLRLLSALHASGIAHGDLQHGNIIVEHGQLRLVDHDGIFVPTMAGWTASEVGHQHYQHPRRTAENFDSNLDNFSALVIYLSLLSLAERPALWQEHHDENLLFTKSDFADPAASELFRKIRDLGPEHARLAEVLVNGATGAPDQVPSLLDLVQAKSRLPTWMTAPADLDATTKTREVVLAEPRVEREPRWVSWQEKSRGPSMPTTPGSPFVQTLFSSPAPAAASVSPIKDPHDLLGNTYIFSKEFVRKYFLLWYWAGYMALRGFGFELDIALFAALICMLIGCVTYGAVKAREESRKAKNLPPGVAWQPPTLAAPRVAWQQPPAVTAPPPGQHFSMSLTPQVSSPATTPVTPVLSDPFVGNIVLGIYHVENCDWVDHISTKNRVGFRTAAEATSHGFKPCRICSPPTT
ncbi:MAG TPA: serine/threonine-protein kinase [Pyrinomonadaceae bacterium]|nr:serine/threonine-protein kinase [Pyrinomonadaceae bacterium]